MPLKSAGESRTYCVSAVSYLRNPERPEGPKIIIRVNIDPLYEIGDNVPIPDDALVHPEDQELVSAAIQRALDNDVPYELEFRAVRPDSAVIWVFTSAAILRDGDRPALPKRICQRFSNRFSPRRNEEEWPGAPHYQRIVNKHGGRIEVTSESGRGTILKIYLPSEPKIPTDSPVSIPEISSQISTTRTTS